MGLDNGLLIKPKTEKGAEFLDSHFNNLKLSYYKIPTYEFAYFRKCWNIRAKIFDEKLGANGIDYKLKINDLKKFSKVMEYFLNRENWIYDNNNSIWEWEIQVANVADAIKRIYIFFDYLEGEEELTDEDFEIIWYDSY